MNRSESIVNIAKALLVVQQKLEAVTKSSSNPYFKSSYADLTSTLQASKPILTEVKIVLMQSPGKDEQGRYVETLLIHESGEWVSGRVYLTSNADDDMQKLGAAITYARRQGLQAVLSMETEDDDGEQAVGRGKSSSSKKSAAKNEVTSVPMTITQSGSEITGNEVSIPVENATGNRPSSFKRPSASNGTKSSTSKGVF